MTTEIALACKLNKNTQWHIKWKSTLSPTSSTMTIFFTFSFLHYFHAIDLWLFIIVNFGLLIVIDYCCCYWLLSMFLIIFSVVVIVIVIVIDYWLSFKATLPCSLIVDWWLVIGDCGLCCITQKKPINPQLLVELLLLLVLSSILLFTLGLLFLPACCASRWSQILGTILEFASKVLLIWVIWMSWSPCIPARYVMLLVKQQFIHFIINNFSWEIVMNKLWGI